MRKQLSMRRRALPTIKSKESALRLEVKKARDAASDYEKRLKYAAENTSLPKDPDYDRIQEFVMDVNRKAVLNAY